jgi:hypothetical protein
MTPAARTSLPAPSAARASFPASAAARRARAPHLSSSAAAARSGRARDRADDGLVRPGLGRALLTDDTGAATAEYAIATMAAVGFASLLVVIMRSDEVRGILTDMVRAALTVGV